MVDLFSRTSCCVLHYFAKVLNGLFVSAACIEISHMASSMFASILVCERV